MFHGVGSGKGSAAGKDVDFSLQLLHFLVKLFWDFVLEMFDFVLKLWDSAAGGAKVPSAYYQIRVRHQRKVFDVTKRYSDFDRCSTQTLRWFCCSG